MRRTGRSLFTRPAAPLVVAAVVAGSLQLGLLTASAEETPGPAPAPAVAPEEGETVVGELTRTWGVQGVTDEDPAPLSWVRTESGETVRIPTSDVSDIEVGSTVEVSLGEEAPDAASAEQGMAPARDVLSASVLEDPAAAVAPATNEVTIVRVIPTGIQGGPADTATTADIVAQVDGPVRTYWSEQTNGGIQLSATAWPDWVTVPVGCENPYGILDHAADAVGFVAAPGRHLLVYLSGDPGQLPNCGVGFAEQGTDAGAGGMAYVKGMATGRIAKQLGHNFGLGESTILKCQTSPYVASFEDGNCYAARDPVTDFYDVMGGNPSQLGSLNAAQAALLGFVDSASQQSVVGGQRSDVTYELRPLGGRTGLRTVEIDVPAAGEMYWLEYRTATGQDAWLGDSRNYYNLESGVFLRRLGPDWDYTSVLLDGTPSTAGGAGGDLQTALPVGTVFDVAGGRANGGVTVTVEGISSAGARVRVASGAPATTNRLPSANWETLSTGPWRSGISVGGWAFDADDPTYPVKVHVYVDGQLSVVTADKSRADVGAAFPGVGNSHGFSTQVSVAPGTHRVCVYAIDSYVPSVNTALGCRTITSQMAMAVGNWEGMSTSGSTISVVGWALDPDDLTQPSEVRVFVDGHETAHTADVSRPDVGAAFPGAGNGHGFAGSITAAPGEHRVCVYAVDADIPSRSTAFGCRTAATQVALPVGNWEGLSASGGNLTVRGWTFDPDDGGRSVPVHVYVDGRASVVAANQARPDVGAAFPAAGSLNGFSASIPVAPGEHRVCLYAIDADLPFRNAGLGCRTINTQIALPIGNWEGLSASGGNLTVRGWTFDPDDGARAVPVHVYVDGRASVIAANQARPDVAAVFPTAGSQNGFSASIPVAPGEHRVCLYAIDADLPVRNTALGCRTIGTQAALPVGNWEGLSASGGNLTVRGWTFDPDDGGRAVPVHVYVDGRASVVAANQARPDVGAAFPAAGSLHGFSASIPVAPGEHRVCLYAIDVDLPFRNTGLGCRTVSTQMALPIGNWESLSASGGNVTVRGWTFDPDDGGRAVPVHVYVDGQASVIAADQARPDVGAVFPSAGSLHGFSASVPASPGGHRVCLYAIDVDLPWRNTGLGCRSVSVG